jgi:hypothetical protein
MRKAPGSGKVKQAPTKEGAISPIKYLAWPLLFLIVLAYFYD